MFHNENKNNNINPNKDENKNKNFINTMNIIVITHQKVVDFGEKITSNKMNVGFCLLQMIMWIIPKNISQNHYLVTNLTNTDQVKKKS